MLANLQQSVRQNSTGLTLSYSLQGTKISAQAQQSQPCMFADVVADAKAQALKLAGAAGLSLGGILALSGSISTTISTSYVPTCSVTVKFGVK